MFRGLFNFFYLFLSLLTPKVHQIMITIKPLRWVLLFRISMSESPNLLIQIVLFVYMQTTPVSLSLSVNIIHTQILQTLI